jgi:hypothetical protein
MLRKWSSGRAGVLLLSLLALGIAWCGSSPSRSGPPSGTKAGTTQRVDLTADGAVSVSLSGAVKGKLTHVYCQDPVTAFISGRIKRRKYELQVTAPKYSLHYVMLWSGSTPTDGWYARMNSKDKINASGGSVNDNLPPNPTGSASGTVRVIGHWRC